MADQPPSGVIYEVNVSVEPAVAASFETVLAEDVANVLALPGCFFTHAEIFKAQGNDANTNLVLLIHGKSVDGLHNYLRNHAEKMREVFAPFAATTTITRRIMNQGRKVLPCTRPNFGFSSRPTTANVEPQLFSTKGHTTSQAFEGALGVKSSALETTTNRFTDFHVHKHVVPEDHKNSQAISKAADIEARFYQYHLHKAAPHTPAGSVGITSKEQDYRNPANRFQHDGKHFGQINPLAGPDPVAGVTASHQPHEIDRFDNAVEHHGHMNPLAGPGVIAGVTAANQPHEIDRFEAPKQHHGQLNPNAGPGVIAGVTAANQPHEIDRFDTPKQHHGQRNPNAGPGIVAGIDERKENCEIDRFDNAVEHHGHINPLAGPGIVAGVSSAMEPQAKEINRFQNMGSASSSRQGTPSRVRQPPGGVSTFTFG